MNFDEAIQTFRAGEDVESVLVLLGKDSLQNNLRKVALAWAKIPVKTDREKHFDDGPDLWEQLWGAVDPDMDRLASVTNTTREDCRRYLTMLRGYRLIYPDGTLATVAQKALRALAKSELGL